MTAASAKLKIPEQLRPFLSSIGRLGDTMRLPAYAVGGCVRDWVLGTGVTPDIDVTVEGEGIALARAAAQALGAPVTVHEQFGTATLVLEGVPGTPARQIDVASCRKETYAEPAAYPRVMPGTLEEDLFRRDFTINAMAMALSPGRFGALIDPFGGVQDLKRKRLRILHARSFEDDPSRILRGIRFAERFALAWEPATERALRAAVDSGVLARLNAGRFRKELEHMSEESDPLKCLRVLAGVLHGAGDRARSA